MIKKVFHFFIFIIVLFIYNTSFSNWYGNHPVAYGNPGGTSLTAVRGGGPNSGTWCGSDGDTSGGSHPTLGERAVALNNSSSTLTPHGAQSSIAPSGTLRCLYWDADIPTGTINYPDIWTNTSQNITYSANDAGGSKLNIVRLERRQITITDTGYSGSWSAPRATVPGQNYTGLNTNTFTTHTYTQPFNNRIAYQYRVYTEDVAGNTGSYDSPHIIHMENEIPDGRSLNINVDNNDNPTHIVSFSGWTNITNQTVRMFIGDTGGSKIKQYILKRDVSIDNTDFATWPGTRTTVASGSGVNSNYITPTYSYTGLNERAYRFRLIVEDYAGNSYTFEDPNMITKIDTEVPLTSDISSPSLRHLLANDSYDYIETTINRNGGSPIETIDYCFEDSTSINSWLSQVNNFLPYNNNDSVNTYFHFSPDISNVDNDINGNGARVYSYKISKVCDNAGNCLVGNPCSGIVYSNIGVNDKAFDYNVYANTISPATFNFRNVTTNEVSNPLNVADGTVKNITITLKDRYGNEIVPASGIGRDIDFNFDVNNSLHLDQYTQSGNGVFMSIPNNSISFLNRLPYNNIVTSFDNQTSSDGTYNFGFRIYTPTWPNYMAEPGGDVIINDITFDIKDTHPDIPASASYDGASLTGANNINFDFRPKYEASFAGEIDTYGFIEGSVQNSSINITDNSASIGGTISNDHIYMEFGSGVSNLSSPDLNITLSGGTMHYVEEGHTGSITNLSNPLNITSQNIQTLLTQESLATLDSLQHAHLSTHIGYTITNAQLPGGHIDVRYNSDIIGKTNYLLGLSNDNTYQSGLKVLGNTSSKKTHEIMTNQDSSDLHILGNLTKASLRKDLKRKVYMIVRNISPTTNHTIDNLIGNIWDIQYGDNRIYNNKVIYYNTSGNVELGDGTTNLTVEGKKTIIIEGANLYIRSNMFYGDKTKDILGIIVLSDKDGHGGNIYIDPSVTNIVGILYADKSLISYDGTNELDGDTDQSILNNQLHIYGSVFSENTIGGSRANPLECPYYITTTCTQEEAQKYDLNYLRRYFIYDSNSNGSIDDLDIAANSGTNYKSTFNTSTYRYARYPLVIEYNSLLQSSPPPMFNK